MPSNPHESLFRKVDTVAAQIKAALLENHPDDLPELLDAHRRAMTALRQADFRQDPDALVPAERTLRRIAETTALLVQQRDELARQLVWHHRRKKAGTAYSASV